MVKQKSSTHLDRNMNTYKIRTPYGGSTNHAQLNASQHNRVQVAHSNGCCSSKKTQNTPLRPVIIQQSEKHQPTAHERSHSRLDPPDPFYYHHGRIKKKPNRIKKPYQQQYGKNQIYTARPTTDLRQTNYNSQPAQTTSKKKNSCCTIL